MELWIARDKDGTISLTNEKPILSVSKTNWLTSGNSGYIELDSEMFPEVTFENSPKKVELKLIEEIVGVKESPLKTFQKVNEFETGASYRR